MKFWKRKPKLISLYGWNKNKSTAKLNAKDFDKLFKGCHVVYDLEENKIYAPFAIGEHFVIVYREPTK